MNTLGKSAAGIGATAAMIVGGNPAGFVFKKHLFFQKGFF
jgi:hypothetical protein